MSHYFFKASKHPFVCLFLFSLFCFIVLIAVQSSKVSAKQTLSKYDISVALTPYAINNQFPSTLEFTGSDLSKSFEGSVEYTFDPSIHDDMTEVYLRYRPDYACFVAMDADTGAILNISSFMRNPESWDNLVMRAEYPAASVFKIITAAGGIDLGKISESTVIPYNGRSTTLYKSQVLRHKDNKHTRRPTFTEAFAKSMNPVFARIGVFHLGGKNLKRYAEKFGFNKLLETDFQLPASEVKLDLSDEWSIAEAASGYTREITLSPIHAAQIAAIVANNGKMVVPYMVEAVYGDDDELLYQAQNQSLNNEATQVIKLSTAKQLQNLMEATPKIGSARKSFSGISKYRVYDNMRIGGKTGSLTGFSPKGRHDWFVGFAEKNGRRIAYASLIVNKEKWYVRSSYVARQFIYNYFSNIEKAEAEVALNN